MGFAIVQDAFCAKMTAFVYGVSVPGVTLARKPNCTNAEFGLYDIWFHRMEFKVPCLEGDWPELLAALQKDETDVKSNVSVASFEQNKNLAYIANLKRLAGLLKLDSDVARKLAGEIRKTNTHEHRFTAAGAVVRTTEESRMPWFLIGRSWHGRVAGVSNASVTPETQADKATTPASCLAYEGKEVFDFPRNLYHLCDLVPSDMAAPWNSICVAHHEMVGGTFQMIVRISS